MRLIVFFAGILASQLARTEDLLPATGEKPEFAVTIPNKAGPPTTPPPGMVWIPGGEFSMGANIAGRGSCEMAMVTNDAIPVHRVRVGGFWMDVTAVTNEQFEGFVN